MNILRKLLGNDAILSEPVVPAAAAAAPSAAEKEAAMRAELAGADATGLTEIALTGKRAALRLLAAEALAGLETPRATWETIAHTWADKDRRLSRLAREHIAAFVRLADLDTRAALLTADFNALMDKPAIDLSRLIELDATYDQLRVDARADALKAAELSGDAPGMASTKVLEALSELRTLVGTRLESGQDAQRQLISIEREADSARLALVAQQTVADPLVHAALAERFADLDTSAVPDVIIARTRKALGALEQLVQSAIARGASELACRELIARINTLDPLDLAARDALEADIVAANLPQDLLVRAKDAYDIHTGGADAAKRQLELAAQDTARAERKASRHSESKAASDALLALVNETEAHLAAGEAKAAIKAAGAIKLHRGEAERAAPALRARFHAIETEVLKLEGFARDVARTQRAVLMERARKLPELTLNIDMLRNEVQTLQNEWKQLDADAGGAPRKLWDEFHALTSKAYETVTLYRAVKAAERDEHLKIKETQLAEIEALVAAVSGGGSSRMPRRGSKAGAAGTADTADTTSSTESRDETGDTGAISGIGATDSVGATVDSGTTEASAAPGEAPADHAAPASSASDTMQAVAPPTSTEPPEWNKIAARRGELVRQWYDQGGVGRKEQKALQVRMDKAVKAIDKALDAERGRERARRRGLIDLVEAARLRAETERPTDAGVNDRPWPALSEAMQVSQDCQKQWNQRVSPLLLPRKEEQALWERFRALGNSVFEMRAQAREAVKQKQGAEREQQVGQLAALRALTQEADRAAVQARLTELQTAWRQNTVRPEHRVERQYDDAVQAVRTHLTSLKRRDERSVWDALLDLDAALAQAEQQPGAPEAPARIEQILPKLDAKHAAHPGINARKSAALQGKPLTAKVPRVDLLLDLELALGIPAQAGEEAARRARQMVLLSTTLKDRGIKREPREMLLNLVAQPGSTARARLEAVIAKL